MVLAGGLVLASCGAASEPGGPGASGGAVVVTYSVLGDVVAQLVDGRAPVTVIIPDGRDPHEFSPSARDVEAIEAASIVVANGLDLEEGLVEPLELAADAGTRVFYATDHITVRELDPGAPADEHGDEHDEHGHDGGDPHLWTDPNAMAELLPDLAAALEDVLGVDLDERLAALQADLADLDTEVRSIMSVVPEGECKLVTGHESLGYFADRYGCELVGAVVPSLSSTAAASARDLAELADLVETEGVRAIFTDAATPSDVAVRLADDLDVALVELPSHDLPDEGGYQAFVVELATRIADGLTSER